MKEKIGTVRYGTVRCGTVRYGTVRYGTVHLKKSKLSSLFYKLFYVNLCRFFFPGAGSRSCEPEPVKIKPAPQH